MSEDVESMLAGDLRKCEEQNTRLIIERDAAIAQVEDLTRERNKARHTIICYESFVCIDNSPYKTHENGGRTLDLDPVMLGELFKQRDALKAALREAATSLRTIADGAGTNYGIETMFNVRGFANSRSVVAERALDGVK